MRTKLQPGETVALIVRKHWLVLVKPALFLAAVLLYLPVRHVKILGFEALLNYLLPYAAVRFRGSCSSTAISIEGSTSGRSQTFA